MTKKTRALKDGDCIHGLGRFQCAACYHPKGTCDYGHCQHRATQKMHSNHEIRSLCAKHAQFLSWEGQLFPYTMQNAAIWKMVQHAR